MAPGPTPLVRDARTALERAQREFERGRLREAIELLEHALTFVPDHVPARTMLAFAYARTRQVDRAFEQLDRAVALAPEAFGPRCALGELYLRLGVPEEARSHLAAALELASDAGEREYVQKLLKEDRVREKRRAPRPSYRQPFWLFEQLRRRGDR